MLKTYLVLALLMTFTSCSTIRQHANDVSSEINNDGYALENAANTVDRAIATEKRLEERYLKKK